MPEGRKKTTKIFIEPQKISCKQASVIAERHMIRYSEKERDQNMEIQYGERYKRKKRDIYRKKER